MPTRTLKRSLRVRAARLVDWLHPKAGEAALRAVRAYWIALALVAATNVVIFGALMGVIGADTQAHALHQRSLEHRQNAHRVAGLLRLIANEPDGVFVERDRNRALGALDALKANQARLAAVRETRSIFEASGGNLTATTAAFLRDAKRAIETGDERASADLRAALSGPFMDGLNALAGRHKAMAEAATSRTAALHWTLLCVTLMLLVGEALLIFRPLVRDLTRIEARLRIQQEELRRQSHHDQLTGLPNRRRLRDHVEALEKGTLRHCVVAMDLDNFKAANDAFGHAAGDRLLLVVADALRDCIRDADQAFRIGGDEFVIILSEERPGTDWSKGMELATGRMAVHVRECLARMPEARGVSASFGYREMGKADPFDMVLADADAALYHAKTSGKDQVIHHSPELAAAQNERQRVETLIRDALARDAFEPWFQPQVDIATGRANGLEVLARLRRADGTVCAPDVFMEFATESGLICAIGEQVTAKALRASAAWPEQRLSLNLSLAQLHDPDLIAFLAGQMDPGRARSSIEFEVPEAVLDGDDRALDTVRELQEAGYTVAVDDFGRGMVSLAAMARAGVARLKVDRSVLRTPERRDEILGVIRSLAASFGIEAIVEGVETGADLTRVREAGYEQAQGFAFARPMDERRTHHWLAAGAATLSPSFTDVHGAGETLVEAAR